MKQILLTIVLACAGTVGTWAASQAYDFEENGLFFSIIDAEKQTVEIVCANPGDTNGTRGLWAPQCQDWPGNSYSGDVTVPAHVSHLGKSYTVTAVGKGCFVNCEELISVILPGTVTKVADEAFSFCPKLTKVILPDEISDMGRLIFSHSTALSEIDWPASQKTIPDQTFEYTGASSSTFNFTGYENVEYIGDYAFMGCPLKSIDLSENADMKTGFAPLYTESLQELTLPTKSEENGYTEFLRSLLTGCDGLQKISIYTEVPPTADDNLLAEDSPIYANAVLYVPEASVSLYSTAPFWKNFRRIEVSSTEKILTSEISAFVDVYTSDGLLIKKGAGRGEATDGLAPGVYIIGGKKVLVP